MAYTNNLAWETLRSIDSATFTGSYQALGTKLSYPSSILKLVNNSDKLVTVSIDGSTDIDILPAGSFFLYDGTKLPAPSIQFFPKGTQFYVKGSAGTGLVYLVSIYQKTT